MASYDSFTIKDIPFRVTYEGCDILHSSELPKLSALKTLPSISSMAVIRCFVEGKVHWYYANKTHHQLVELNPKQAVAEEFDKRFNTTSIELNQPVPLSQENLRWVEKEFHLRSPLSRKVTNIEVALTPSEHSKLLKKLYDPRATSKNATYTYLFQNYLARYQGEMVHHLAKLHDDAEHHEKEIKHIERMQIWARTLHHLSTQFTVFEERINHTRDHDPESVVQALLQEVKEYGATIKKVLQNIRQQYSDFPEIQSLLLQLEKKIQSGNPSIDTFQIQLQSMLERGVTSDQASRLLSIQTRDHTIHALGTFVAEQMAYILDYGIKVTYEFSDHRFADLIRVPPLVSALSDAKKNIQLKAFSLDGAEYNDTYLPIPENMLAALRPDVSSSEERQWFSLRAYLQLNPQEIDKTICLITGENFQHRKSAKFLFSIARIGESVVEAFKVIGLGFFKLIASAMELILYVPIRLMAMLVLTGVDLAGSALNFVISSLGSFLAHEVSKIPGFSWLKGASVLINLPFLHPKNDQKFTNWLDQRLSMLHERFSIVKSVKRLANRRYQRVDHDGNALHNQHQELIHRCADESNFFHEAFVYFSPQRVASYIKRFFSSLWRSIAKFFNDIAYLMATPKYRAKPRDVYSLVRLRYQLTQQYRQKLETKNLKREQDYLQQLMACVPEEHAIHKRYSTLKYCPVNEVSSPLEVFREIMLTLDDTVVDPMFRKSPGAATFFFMISMSTLGTYLVPSAYLTWMKSVPSFLQIPTDFLSLHFTGKATSEGLMEQMVACFLEWKLGFFTTELLIEVGEGNFDFFNEIVKEPEQVVLGLVGLIGMGVSLKYLPLFPTVIQIPPIPGMPPLPPIYNYYAEVINVFIDEAKSCAEGTPVFTSIEYGFLGLKFAMLLHSMLAGTHKHHHAEVLQGLAEALSGTQFLEKLMKACHRHQLFDKKTEEDIKNTLNIILEELLTQISKEHHLKHRFSADQLNVFKKVLQQHITSSVLEECLQSQDRATSAAVQNALKQVDPEAKLKLLIAANHPPKDETPLAKAHRELQEAIKITSDAGNPLIFNKDPLKEAYKFYDHLDVLFKRYNHELQKIGRADLCLNKRAYLDVFFNKYCYQGSNNFLRSLLFFPVPLPIPPYYFPGIYLLAVLFRGAKYLVAWWQQKPSVMHQVKKSFNKDLVLLFQIASIINRTIQVMARALSYSLRPFVALVLLILSVVPYALHRFLGAVNLIDESSIMSGKSWFKAIDAWTCTLVAFHHTWPWHTGRTIYAQSARTAGLNTNVEAAGKEILASLEFVQNNKILEGRDASREKLPYISTQSSVGKILERYDRARTREKNSTKTKDKSQEVWSGVISSKSSVEIAAELGPVWGYKAQVLRQELKIASTFFMPSTPKYMQSAVSPTNVRGY